MAAEPLNIGCAAGFSGDRIDAAEPVVRTLIARGGPACLIFETLAERTLALAQLRRRSDPASGYEQQLDAMLRPILAACLQHGIRIVGNFGAANPEGAARRILALAGELGLRRPRVAAIAGDDLSGPEHRHLLQERLGSALEKARVVSANAYIGADALVDALHAGAEIVVAGRIADPTLAVAPARWHFGWADDDWDRIARATMAGHLLECGAQVTGGYFADPGYKDVPDLATVGFPIAGVDNDGHCTISKADATGGMVTLQTVKEQLLYEIHDPAAYLTPDVVADLSDAEVHEVGANQVALKGVQGHPRPATLKVNVCHEGGWLAEAEISYAGAGAERRARLAADVLRQRLQGLALRVDLIGVVSVLADDGGRLLQMTPSGESRDVRLRIASAQAGHDDAERVCRELTSLYTCGPAGGGGVRTSIRARLNTLSCFVPREQVATSFRMID
jgi:hypothetical protein